MELVYLWVDDYKNIKNQGFNFSPRFECKYDEDTEELTINEKEHIKNFFGKNVNITAIVGENGSGKSNILNLIIDLDGWATTTKKIIFITLNNNNPQLYLVNFANKIICNQKVSQHLIDRKRTGIASYALSNIGLNFSYLSLSPFLHRINNYYSNGNIDFLSIYNYKANFNNSKFNFDDFFLSLIPYIPKILEHNFVNSLFSINKKPSYLVFEINKHIETLFPDEVEKILKKSIEKRITKHTFFYQIKIDNLSMINSLDKLNKKIEKHKESISKEINELSQKKKRKKIPNISNKDIINKVNLVADLEENRNVEQKNKLEEELSKTRTIEFSFSYDESSKEFHFSTGELILLFYIKKLQDLNKYEKDFILCIDECELFLHPEWQKKFIKFLSKLFKDTEYNHQIIISTHSPFILSDIPKENIIFLKNGGQDHPFKDNEQTFGANIHTLLSHGFFMKDGLMGEFAKEKINNVIKLLNTKSKRKLSKKNQKFCEDIISIIGEPILQKTLQHQLNEKLNPNETELEKLQREQKEIKEKIDTLTRDKNETN